MVAFITLGILLVYKVFISKHVTRKQCLSVFTLVTIVNTPLAIMGFYQWGEQPQPGPPWDLIVYGVGILASGLWVAHITRSSNKPQMLK
jgi:hypothetical protein